MESTPEITIIMPVYNVEKYIERSISSVLDQTFRNFEFIIVNDGSTDNSGKLIDKYKIDDRVIIINKENGGPSAARNVALDIMRGKYVTFIDSDDFIDSRYLETLVNLIKEYDVGISICNMQKVHGDVPEEDIENGKVILRSSKKHVRDMFGPRMSGAYAWGKMYRRECFEKIRFPEGRLYEDIFLIPYVVYPVGTIAYTTAKLYCYRQRQGSILAVFNEDRRDEIYSLRTMVDYAAEHKDRLLCWYARINEVRSYIEIKHRCKKYGVDFESVRNDFKGRLGKDLFKIFIPVF